MSPSDKVSQQRLLRRQVRQQWTVYAPEWLDKHDRHLALGHYLTKALIDLAQPKAGMQVLDLACGSGDPALDIAALIEPGGRLCCLDLIAKMLQGAKACLRRRQLDNAVFQQAELEALPYRDQSFDLVICRLGIMFAADVQQALGEIRRVLKPGGRCVLSAYGPRERQGFNMTLLKSIQASVDLPAPQASPLDPYRFSEDGVLAQEMALSFFRQIEESCPDIPIVFSGPLQQHRDFIRAEIESRLGDISSSQREAIVQRAQKAVEAHWDGRQLNFSGAFVLVAGVR